jgi:hypothetical protein
MLTESSMLLQVSMALQDFIKKERLDRLVRDLEKIGHVSADWITPQSTALWSSIFAEQITVSKDMAILSLVGRQMRHMVGIAGKMFSTLADGNVNIEMISQGWVKPFRGVRLKMLICHGCCLQRERDQHQLWWVNAHFLSRAAIVWHRRKHSYQRQGWRQSP